MKHTIVMSTEELLTLFAFVPQDHALHGQLLAQIVDELSGGTFKAVPASQADAPAPELIRLLLYRDGGGIANVFDIDRCRSAYADEFDGPLRGAVPRDMSRHDNAARLQRAEAILHDGFTCGLGCSPLPNGIHDAVRIYEVRDGEAHLVSTHMRWRSEVADAD